MVTIDLAHGISVEVIRVLGDRILLRELRDEEIATQTESGLWLPDAAEDHQRILQGEILAVGEDVSDPILLPGLRVICSRWSRIAVDQDGIYWVASEDAIQAIITIT